MTLTPPHPHRTFSESTGKRILFIDALRGFTMLLVIYSHIIAYLIPINTAVNEILITFRMPLFFFISGFFMYSSNYNPDLLKHRTKNRLVKQLLPTLLFFTLYIIIGGKSFVNGITSTYKAGYWFTFVSVETFLITAPVLCLITVRQYNRIQQIIILGILAAVSFVISRMIGGIETPHPVIACFDLNLLSAFLPYVISGCLVKMIWQEYERVIMRARLFICSLAAFCLCLFVDFAINNIIMAMCGIYLFFYTFYRLPDAFFTSKCGKALIFTGKSTLEIYLLHYFVFGLMNKLPPVGRILSPLLNTGNSMWEIPSFLFISVIIAATCLAAVKLMKLAKVYPLFFPQPHTFNARSIINA